MTLAYPHRVAAIATFLLASSLPVQADDKPPAAGAKQTGDLWEVTSQMSMEGMPTAMPSQTQSVCAPKEWKEPPAAMDERRKCEISDYKSAGSTVSWKVRCPGPPAMTGEGEITRDGADAYTGLIKFNSPEGSMKIKLGGRRLGDCDPGRK